MKIQNFTPTGPAPEQAPLRVRLERMRWSHNDHFRDRNLCIPRDVEAFYDVPYVDDDLGEWHLMDVYRPKNVPVVLPTIVSVHGGGYFYGNKELYRHYCMGLAQLGFGVVNFNYRVAPEYRFPAPLEDVNSVLTWLEEHGAEYGLDTNNLFMVGDSAGAQIASQYAAIWSNEDYAALFGFAVPEVRIRAVGLNCGMYDLPSRPDPVMQDYLGDLFGSDDPRLDVYSAIDSRYPPSYLISSYGDFLLACCQPMAELLKSRGVDTEYKIYGRPGDLRVGHVFHVNMRMNEGKEANRDETTFFRLRQGR